MFGTVYTSYSGLMANSKALNVIGNNLANVNTVGFKTGRADFAQIMASTIGGYSGGGSPIQLGLGVRNTAISPTYRQGALQNTGITSQLALQGNGFFQVANPDTGNLAYTRAGNFGFDEDGFMITASGDRVQGFSGTNADGTVNATGALGDIQLDLGQGSPPQATQLIRFLTNFAGNAVEGDAFSSKLDVFDSAGGSRTLTVNFSKTGTEGEWAYDFEFPDGTISTTQSGTLQFGSNGQMTGFNGTSIFADGFENPVLNIAGVDGADDLAITWDLGVTQPDEDGNGGGSFMTTFGERSNSETFFQDGYGSGELQKVDFGPDGTMRGIYSNGVTLGLARVAVATFNNNQGLKQANGGYFTETAASGEAQFDNDNIGRGSMHSGFLESSNVDVAEELTSLIVHQRGYQGNSKTITTADQVLQEILSLKR